jgi:hypothetical protein
VTPTLSDFPLLIGEILRRKERRILKQAERRPFFVVVGKILGMRIPWRLGGRTKSSLIVHPAIS